MKILCIEDNEKKYNDIVQQIRKFKEHAMIDWAAYGNLGLCKLSENQYDLVVLDMSLPISSINDRKDMLYGENILDEIKRCRMKVNVLVITGFDQFEYKTERLTFEELYARMKKKYNKYLLDMVYYDQSSMEWVIVLGELLNKFE